MPSLPIAVRPPDRPELPPAPLSRRFAAAVLDVIFVLAALAALLVVTHLRGVPIGIGPHFLLSYGAVFTALLVAYKTLYALGNRDCPGAVLARLRLLRFDRREPQRRDRLVRVLSGVVTIGGLGIALIWAVSSPERHTWYDAISRTCMVERSNPPRQEG
ncbi:MAG: RDD family protein [Bryobacteraceae bacterium]